MRGQGFAHYMHMYSTGTDKVVNYDASATCTVHVSFVATYNGKLLSPYPTYYLKVVRLLISTNVNPLELDKASQYRHC